MTMNNDLVEHNSFVIVNLGLQGYYKRRRNLDSEYDDREHEPLSEP